MPAWSGGVSVSPWATTEPSQQAFQAPGSVVRTSRDAQGREQVLVELDPDCVARVHLRCIDPARLCGVDLGEGGGVARGVPVEALQGIRESDMTEASSRPRLSRARKTRSSQPQSLWSLAAMASREVGRICQSVQVPLEPSVQGHKIPMREGRGLSRAGDVELYRQPLLVLASAGVGQIPTGAVREPRVRHPPLAAELQEEVLGLIRVQAVAGRDPFCRREPEHPGTMEHEVPDSRQVCCHVRLATGRRAQTWYDGSVS